MAHTATVRHFLQLNVANRRHAEKGLDQTTGGDISLMKKPDRRRYLQETLGKRIEFARAHNTSEVLERFPHLQKREYLIEEYLSQKN